MQTNLLYTLALASSLVMRSYAQTLSTDTLGLSCTYNLEAANALKDRVQKAILEGSLLPLIGANSGVYVAKEANNPVNLAVIKPADERNKGPQNRKKENRADDLSEEEQYQRNHYSGHPEKRQMIARKLDFGSSACQPEGYIDEVTSDQFFSVDAEKTGKPAGVQKKTAFVQKFVSGVRPLVEFHPQFLQDRKKAYDMKDNPILDQVPLQEFQKVALLDLLLYNEDRHPGNILISKDLDGNPHLVPIDMDMILPGTFHHTPRTGLFAHSRAQSRLTPESLAWIKSLNPEEVASTVRQSGLAEPLAQQAKILAVVLKKLGPDFSIAEISKFIFSTLDHLVKLSQTNAEKALSPKDLESYQKEAELRKKAWAEKPSDKSMWDRLTGTGGANEKWRKEYETKDKLRIEKQLDDGFWARFHRGLDREFLVIQEKKLRDITFGTTYVAGNKDRDSLSKLVSDNQQEYAQYWGLNGKAVTKSLLAKECTLDGISQDCVPYWNKIAVLRKWINEPSSGKEEWYMIADDDMPVTNMNINPYEAIDVLREGRDASIIIARDVVSWTGGHRDYSVNTGLLIVRKNQKSKDFLEKLWAKRNDPTSSRSSSVCPTLGTCKNQDVLHEQEAFARVLKDDPTLLQGAVKVVNYRNRYNEKELALNTFRRHGCFIRVQDGWGSSKISYNDPSDGAWKPGDWMGQTAGVPVSGMDCTTESPKSFRIEYLRHMLDKTIQIDAESIRFSPDATSGLPGDGQLMSDEAWEKYIRDNKLGAEGEIYLAKIQDESIKARAKYYMDEVILEKLDAFMKNGNMKDAKEMVSKIHSISQRQEISKKIDVAFLKHIVDKKLGIEGFEYIDQIQDESIKTKARESIEEVLLDNVKSLTENKKFEEAKRILSRIETASLKEQATKSLDQGLLTRVKHILTKTVHNKKYNAAKNYDCPDCYWPKDFDSTIEHMISQITDPEVVTQARRSIEESFAKYIKDGKFGTEGLQYLDKIQDPTIRAQARGYIDTALLEKADALAKKRKFKEAREILPQIEGEAAKKKASDKIAKERLAFDHSMLDQIKKTVTLTKHNKEYKASEAQDCKDCYWPYGDSEDKSYEKSIEKTLSRIADSNTKKQAQRHIGEAWARYILDNNLQQNQENHLAKIADASVQKIAREHLDLASLKEIASLVKDKKLEEAKKVVSRIHFVSSKEKAAEIIETGVFTRIKHLLSKTPYNSKYDAAKNSDCRGCYWPKDFEATIEQMASEITTPAIQQQVRNSIDEAWIKYIKQNKADAKYLDKIHGQSNKQKAQECLA